MRKHKTTHLTTILLLSLSFLLLSACGNTTPASEAEAVEEATAVVETASGGSDAFEIEAGEAAVQYTIARVDCNIDWATISELSLDNIQWEPDQGVRAYGQLCYDDDALYVHLRAVESNIRAEYTEQFSPVYQDSCLEFFFTPEGYDRYMNFEINPNGCLYVGIGHERADSAPLDITDDLTQLFDIRSGKTDDGWEVYYTIPLSFLQEYYPDCSLAGILYANVYKCGDKTDHKHYLSWNYVDTEKPDFHRPEYFGKMGFEP